LTRWQVSGLLVTVERKSLDETGARRQMSPETPRGIVRGNDHAWLLKPSPISISARMAVLPSPRRRDSAALRWLTSSTRARPAWLDRNVGSFAARFILRAGHPNGPFTTHCSHRINRLPRSARFSGGLRGMTVSGKDPAGQNRIRSNSHKMQLKPKIGLVSSNARTGRAARTAALFIQISPPRQVRHISPI
jgi:hypothetical protein